MSGLTRDFGSKIDFVVLHFPLDSMEFLGLK
jgi:hypothetical protein